MDGTGEARARRRAARAERRHARWHGPPQPKDWRFFVGGFGRILIVLGLLMFGFVAYQLWGTGLEYAQAQDRLDDELEDLFAGAPTTPVDHHDRDRDHDHHRDDHHGARVATGSSEPAATPTAPPTAPTTSTTAVPVTIPVPPLDEGDAIARIEIPAIGLDAVVVAGVHPSDLKKGPGHYPGTPMPGQLGNSAIAGHRTTYGQPFFDLDDIESGEEIVLTTVQGRFVYRMTASEVVAPDQGDVVLTKDPTVATLTLTTCDPEVHGHEPPHRVRRPGPGRIRRTRPAPRARLRHRRARAPRRRAAGRGAGDDGDPPTPVTTSASAGTVGRARRRDRSAGSTPHGAPAATAAPATTVLPDPAVDGANGDPTAVDAFSHGWFSDAAAWPHVIGWGLLCGAIVVGGWFVARAFERYWVGALVALVPFVVALYFFYQNVNRLLPAAI